MPPQRRRRGHHCFGSRRGIDDSRNCDRPRLCGFPNTREHRCRGDRRDRDKGTLQDATIRAQWLTNIYRQLLVIGRAGSTRRPLWRGNQAFQRRNQTISTAPSAQIAKPAAITPQIRPARNNCRSTNRTINSIAQPIAEKMAAAAIKSLPVHRTSSVNCIATAGRRSNAPRNAHKAGRQRPRLAVR
jgi:hypothetical protein